MKISKLIIKSSSGKYPILIGSNVVANISKLMFDNSINFEKGIDHTKENNENIKCYAIKQSKSIVV